MQFSQDVFWYSLVFFFECVHSNKYIWNKNHYALTKNSLPKNPKNRYFKENSSAYELEQGVTGQSFIAWNILVPYTLTRGSLHVWKDISNDWNRGLKEGHHPDTAFPRSHPHQASLPFSTGGGWQWASCRAKLQTGPWVPSPSPRAQGTWVPRRVAPDMGLLLPWHVQWQLEGCHSLMADTGSTENPTRPAPNWEPKLLTCEGLGRAAYFTIQTGHRIHSRSPSLLSNLALWHTCKHSTFTHGFPSWGNLFALIHRKWQCWHQCPNLWTCLLNCSEWFATSLWTFLICHLPWWREIQELWSQWGRWGNRAERSSKSSSTSREKSLFLLEGEGRSTSFTVLIRRRGLDISYLLFANKWLI